MLAGLTNSTNEHSASDCCYMGLGYSIDPYGSIVSMVTVAEPCCNYMYIPLAASKMYRV